MDADEDFDLAPCGLALLTSDGVFKKINRALLDWTGFDRTDLIERKSLADLLDGDGGRIFAGLSEALAREKAADEIFVSILAKSGASLPVTLNLALRPEEDGSPSAIRLAAFRGEKRARNEAELRRGKQAAEQLAAIVAQSTDAIVSIDTHGLVLTANRAFGELFQYDPDKLTGACLADLIVPQEYLSQFDDKLRLAGSGQLRGQIVRRRRKDGQKLELSLSTAAIHDEGGEVVAISAIYRDVAPLMRAAEHIEFLLREVNHRSKNMLAVVQAVARQTARLAPSPEAFIDSFMARLQAIASSHDLLVSRDWRGVQFADLTRTQFSHLDEETRARISITGDFIEINPRAAEAYGLTLHELSTNAARFGALSVPSGKVELRCQIDPGTGTYTLTWRESGGPAVAKPTRVGFGSSVLNRMAPSAIQGESELVFAPEGLIYRLSAPVAQIVMNG